MLVLPKLISASDRIVRGAIATAAVALVIGGLSLDSAKVAAAQRPGATGSQQQGRSRWTAWDDWQPPSASTAAHSPAADQVNVREPLDFQIRRVGREIAAIEQEPDFTPLAVSTPTAESHVGVFPREFQIMALLSIVLSIVGIVVVVRYRPALTDLRGRDDTTDARRRLVRCVAILTAINFADLAFTAFLAPMPEFVELNPVAELLRDCMPALIAAKLSIVGACAGAFVVFWRYKIIQLASWCAATTYVGLALWWVAYFNAARS
jgi:hypothetical protein